MKRIYLHPLPLRIWHWLNAVTVILLLLTGFQYRIPGLANLLPRNFSLELHRWVGIAMTALWAFWLIYGLSSGALRRDYRLRRDDLGGVVAQMKFYLISIFRGEKNPFLPTMEARFNPLQKLTYCFIMGMFIPIMIVTGLLYFNAFSISGHLLFVGAIEIMVALHVAGLYVFAAFLVIHIYMTTLGATVFSHIKAMIVGYEDRVG